MESELIVEEIDFQRYWMPLKRRWKPAAGVFTLATLGALALAYSQQADYQAEARLLFRTDRATSLTGLGESLGRVEALTFQANPLDTQVQVIRSRPIIEATIQELDLRDEHGDLMQPRDVMGNLTVSALAGTDVLSIAYRSRDPDESAQVANKIVEIFIRDNLRENRSEAAAAREFISQQLPQTEAALNRAEVNLREFKERNQVVALGQEASSLVNVSFELQQQIDAAEAQISTLNAEIGIYQSQLNISNSQYAVVLAAIGQSEGVQRALTDLQQVEQEIAGNRALFTADSQAISRLNVRRDNLQFVLNQRIDQVVNNRAFDIAAANLQIGSLESDLIGRLIGLEVRKQGLINQIETLENQQSRYADRMLFLPALEQQQSELERELEVAKATYQGLLARFQQLQVTESQNVGNARLISAAAVPEHPLGSNKKLILAAGMLAGALSGVALAFLLDILDGSVKTVKEAKEIFDFTVLGIIPALGSGEEDILYASTERWVPSLVTRSLGRSPISEAYRMLQTNLIFLSSDQALKSVVVTSSIPQEGKSEVAANLAVVMAESGRRVLLVDADLRHPVQHRVWELSNSVGLSNVLVEQLDYRPITKTVMPNLDILSAGVIPPSPVALLESKRMAALIADFKQAYDFVIFDTPPLLGRADSNVLGKLVDGLLVVVRPGIIDAAKAKLAKELLEQSNQRVLGITINSVDVKQEPDSYFYYTEASELVGSGDKAMKRASQAPW